MERGGIWKPSRLSTLPRYRPPQCSQGTSGYSRQNALLASRAHAPWASPARADPAPSAERTLRCGPGSARQGAHRQDGGRCASSAASASCCSSCPSFTFCRAAVSASPRALPGLAGWPGVGHRATCEERPGWAHGGTGGAWRPRAGRGRGGAGRGGARRCSLSRALRGRPDRGCGVLLRGEWHSVGISLFSFLGSQAGRFSRAITDLAWTLIVSHAPRFGCPRITRPFNCRVLKCRAFAAAGPVNTGSGPDTHLHGNAQGSRYWTFCLPENVCLS